jgi:hypothetical protein
MRKESPLCILSPPVPWISLPQFSCTDICSVTETNQFPNFKSWELKLGQVGSGRVGSGECTSKYGKDVLVCTKGTIYKVICSAIVPLTIFNLQSMVLICPSHWPTFLPSFSKHRRLPARCILVYCDSVRQWNWKIIIILKINDTGTVLSAEHFVRILSICCTTRLETCNPYYSPHLPYFQLDVLNTYSSICMPAFL